MIVLGKIYNEINHVAHKYVFFLTEYFQVS